MATVPLRPRFSLDVSRLGISSLHLPETCILTIYGVHTVLNKQV